MFNINTSIILVKQLSSIIFDSCTLNSRHVIARFNRNQFLVGKNWHSLAENKLILEHELLKTLYLMLIIYNCNKKSLAINRIIKYLVSKLAIDKALLHENAEISSISSER